MEMGIIRVARMRSCKRECVKKWLKIVNLIVNVWGVAMIIYSLCLREIWIAAVSQLSSASQDALPRPWFIFTCLIVAIVVCLSTLWGHMVANCISRPILLSYVASLTALLFIQGFLIVVVFFKMDLESQINDVIDKTDESFKQFVIFNFRMCCAVSIIVFVAQMNIVTLATVLLISSEREDQSRVGNSETWEAPDLRNSFLIYPYAPLTLTDAENRRQSSDTYV